MWTSHSDVISKQLQESLKVAKDADICLGQLVPTDKPHDNHYAIQEIQPLEYLQETLRRHDGFTGFCLGNIIKYASRLGLKDDPQKELAKIIDYAGHLKKHLAGEKVQPRRAKREEN